ncbi:hypothetical protein FZEAL_6921 [Fusarium zealandicum]|uniref:Uncharacterized protein n=1 Tax=Fusarium zealandicum TaxID=1053134 RepID=A0A8H4UGX6_9HYPO|nr:hypothetical protein FZEAL_6921 [Fusarium zealandicum]
MSNKAGNNNAISSSSNMNPSTNQKYSSSKTSDPETASIATFSSTATLVKEKEEKGKATIDAQKLQEQALRSQIRFCM